jgi:hypothetical protein
VKRKASKHLIGSRGRRRVSVNKKKEKGKIKEHNNTLWAFSLV